MTRKLIQLMKTWGTGLIVPLLLGIVLAKSDVAKVPFSTLFPDRNSIGGVTFALKRVPSTRNQAWIELVLVRQTVQPTSKIEFLRRGSRTLSDVYAGISADRVGNALPLTGGINGTRFLELEMPEKTLGGTSLLVNAGPEEKARYVVTMGDVTKDLSDPDDLVVYTRNEALHVQITYILIMVAIAVAAFSVGRAKPLRHPTQADLEDEQWV